MNHLATALAALGLVLFLALPAAAAGEEELRSVKEAVPETARALLGDAEPGLGFRAGETLAAALKEALGLDTWRRETVRSAVAVLAAALFTGLSGLLPPDGKGTEAALLAGILAVGAGSLGGLTGAVSAARDALTELHAFSLVLLPAMASLEAAAGAAAEGTAELAASVFFLDLIVAAASRLVMPLIGAYAALSLASAAFGGAADGPKRLVKWAASTLMGLVGAAFPVVLLVTGTAASGQDAAAVKATKAAISHLVPVVGKLVSDAAETLVAGVGAVRGTLGLFGAAAVLATVLLPLLRAGFAALAFKAAAALAEPVADKRLAALIADLGTAASLAVGAVSLAALSVILAVTALMRGSGI